MTTLKSILFDRYKLFSLLTLSMALSLFLLVIRIKINASFYLLFMVWNLFLAIVPFALSLRMKQTKRQHWFLFIIQFSAWLLFLPNAHYMITDLLHLINSERYMMWLDILVILSFAFNGLILYYLSLFDIEILLYRYIKPSLVKPAITIVIGLTAFGVYLGRFLRFNSWEIISAPTELFSDILDIIIRPDVQAWLFTFTFGTFLAVTYALLKYLNLSDRIPTQDHPHSPEDS